MKKFKLFVITLIFILSHSAQANTIATKKWLTKNGVRVVFFKTMEVPMLDISIAFAAGSAYDGTQFGLSTLTTHMMNQGSAGLDATTIAESLAETGAQFDTENTRDMAIFNLRTLTKKETLGSTIKLFSQIINHPDFPQESFEREKKQILMTIEQANESADETANLNFFKALYQNHPYAHPVDGTAKTVNSINKSDLVAFYKHYFTGANAVLVMVGAIDDQSAHQIADSITRELPKGQPAPVIPKAKPFTSAKQINIKFPNSQTVIRLGQTGIDHESPNYFPLMVGNYILGGGSVSRLSDEVREKRGLTYSISSQFVPMPGIGPFIIGLSTKNDQSKNALDITEKALRTFTQSGPSSQELIAAKQYLGGSFPLSFAGNRPIASLLLRMAFYHLPDDYLDTYVSRINAVTSEQIKLAFKETINPDKLVLVTAGNNS